MGMYEHSFILRVFAEYPGHVARRVIETGTCLGYSTRRLSTLYQCVDTIEIDADLLGKTQDNLRREGYTNVHFHAGDSVAELPTIVREVTEPCVLYFDAHWSGDATVDWDKSEWKGYGVPTAHRGEGRSVPVRSEDQVPLLEELRIVCEHLGPRGVVYIDDYELFDAKGRGRKDVGFVGNDWSHLHVDDLRQACGDRLVDWIVDDQRRQLAIVLTAKGEPPAAIEHVKIPVTPRPARNPSAHPLLGLVMIVRNEARRISQVLASYRPYIDTFTILDTGSTDGTQDLVRAELDGIPGTLHEEPFVDFTTSRNRALDLHDTRTVFTIMPNGDILQGGVELVSFLESHRRDGSGAYRVRIAPGHYYHPLVMRAGGGWRYKWRTHECATGPNQGPQIPGVSVIRDRGQRTDAEWRQRWERDLVLLHQDREADPSDPRPYFYLGQTHECLGQYAEALHFFEKRTQMGGYFDEVFEAKLRIGKMMQKIDRPWAEVQQAFLDAYVHDPRRAEPLYAIADHWYGKEQHHLTRLFARAAAELPKPATDLFLDEEIYSWRAADKAAIACFYAGCKDEGRAFAERAVRACPHDDRLRSNLAFFARSARELFGTVARPIAFTPEAGWQVSNPSIYRGPSGLRCVVRTVNYRIVDGRYVTPPDDVVREAGPYHGWQLIRTRNFLLDLTDDLKTARSVELIDQTEVPRTSYPIHGFEDCRLFEWRGKWWATATVCDITEDGRREIALLEIGDDGGVERVEILRGPWKDRAQKNWMPFVQGDVARLVYATTPSPTILDLVDVDERDVSLLSWHVAGQHAVGCSPEHPSFEHGRLRGGSQGVRLDDGGWIFVVHDVAFPGSGRIYLHRFAVLDADFRLVSMTDPFYFEQLGIEFCAGLARVGDDLVASYSVNDGSARLGVFDVSAVLKALRTDFVV